MDQQLIKVITDVVVAEIGLSGISRKPFNHERLLGVLGELKKEIRDWDYYVDRIVEGQRFEEPEILRLACGDGWTVAHVQASKGWTTEDPDILQLHNTTGWTIAHTQADKGWTTEDPNILRLVDEDEWTVAHVQAQRGWTTEDPDILSLARSSGWSVAHVQAERGWTTEDPDILQLHNNVGWTVAHYQVGEGWTTEDPDILRLHNNFGWTVAHDQACSGWTTEDPVIRKLKDEKGRTVESIQKKKGWKPKPVVKNFDYYVGEIRKGRSFKSPRILKLTPDKALDEFPGTTVAHVQALQVGWTTEDPEILAMSASPGGPTVAALIEARKRPDFRARRLPSKKGKNES